MRQARSNIRGAFTLVELLVVVGIVTALIAILMPALSAARRQAQRVHCAANLRSIGQAMTAYTQTYGSYPCMTAYFGGSPYYLYAIWPTRLRMLMGGQTGSFNCPAQDERCWWVKGQPHAGSETTARDVDVRFGYDPGEPLLDQTAFFSYGYNHMGASALSSNSGGGQEDRGLGSHVNMAFPGDPYGRELRASRVRNPSEMIAVADATADGVKDYAISAADWRPREWPGNIHAGGANVLFCDGHVQWYLQRDLVFDAGSPRPWVSMARMWNNDHHNY